MALTHWDPFRALGRREEGFDELVREFFGRGTSDEIQPPIEVSESDGNVVVKMVVPGVDKDQIDITVDDHTLRVRGELRKETEEKKKDYYHKEIRYGAFERTVPLPAEIDAAKATAQLKNGMLTITAAKAKNGKTHQVKVTA